MTLNLAQLAHVTPNMAALRRNMVEAQLMELECAGHVAHIMAHQHNVQCVAQSLHAILALVDECEARGFYVWPPGAQIDASINKER